MRLRAQGLDGITDRGFFHCSMYWDDVSRIVLSSALNRRILLLGGNTLAKTAPP
jgi:hypothetical protein